MGIPALIFFTPAPRGAGVHELCGAGEKGLRSLKELLNHGYLDTPLDWIKGFKNVRLRDISSFIRTTDPDDIMLSINKDQLEDDAPRAFGIILNTFDALEHDVLTAIRSRLPNLYVIGPISLCLIVSHRRPFFLHRLQPLERRYQLRKMAKHTGCRIGGVPADELSVLVHGVGDGMEIGSDVKRGEVERMVRELMCGEKGREMREKAKEWKLKAREAIEPNGPSFVDLERLVEDLASFSKSKRE
uniref:Uncharacterized protein n=1 Tax=Ananas comosus var. bracteatus TaxID=296719 RepID=A0A6V7QWS6_ANACO